MSYRRSSMNLFYRIVVIWVCLLLPYLIRIFSSRYEPKEKIKQVFIVKLVKISLYIYYI